MKQQVEKIVQSALSNANDNLYRAKTTFANLSDKELDEEYGQSGQTKKEILHGYQKRSDELLQCLNWVKSRSD